MPSHYASSAAQAIECTIAWFFRFLSHHFSIMFRSLLLFPLIAAGIYSFPATLQLPSNTSSSLSLTNIPPQLPFNVSDVELPLEVSNARCTTSRSWFANNVYSANSYDRNCQQALYTILPTDLSKHTRRYEFLSRGATATTGLPIRQSPLRFTYGGINPCSLHDLKDSISISTFRFVSFRFFFLTLTAISVKPISCTVIVAMVEDIPAGLLPDPPARPFAKTAVSTYAGLSAAAETVLDGCVRRYNPAFGWAKAGKML